MLFPCPRHMVSSRKLCVAARNRLEKQVIRPRHMVYVEKPCVANRGSASAEFSSFGGQWSFRPGYRPAMSEMPDQVGHDGERAPGQGPGQTRADQGRAGTGQNRAEQGRPGTGAGARTGARTGTGQHGTQPVRCINRKSLAIKRLQGIWRVPSGIRTHDIQNHNLTL